MNQKSLTLLFALIIPVLFGGGGIWFGLAVAGKGPLVETRAVIIPPQTGLLETAALLRAQEIIGNETLFVGITVATGNHHKIQAGEYEFPARIRMYEVITKLVRGDILLRKITFPEGWTSKQIVAALDQNPFLSGEIKEIPSEGSLMPDTYPFTRGDARGAIIVRMQKSMADFIAAHWPARAPDYFLQSPHDWVNLASIVEAETPISAERPRVAGVYLNRLAKPMRLQADPTTVYGLNDGSGPLDRPLTMNDLKNPHAFNTYMHDGLPPTPINNPGRASLLATLSPEKHGYFFFVADGTGGHAFARTFDEHRQNRDKHQKP